MVYGDLLFIIPILYPILGILALLIYQTLLASLLGIVRGIDGYSIVLNLTQLFSISTRIRERLGNIIVKDIKGTLLLRPRLLESLKLVIENYLQDRKTHLNATTALSTYILIIRTKGIRSNIVRTKSGSYVKVSFSILNRFLLLTLGFNSLGLSSSVPLIFLTTILPGHSLILVLILSNQVKFKTILQLSIPRTIPSKLASSVYYMSKAGILRIG